MSMINFCMGKDLTTTGAVTTDDAFISFINLHSSAAAGSIVIKNGTSTGNVIFKATINANESSKFFSLSIPLKAKDGIYVELTGATATIGYFG